MRGLARVYIGWDPREEGAYRVASDSLWRNASIPVYQTPVILETLEKQGLLSRPRRRIETGRAMHISNGRIERRIITAAMRGTWFDLISGAPMSTQFAISRFAVPILQHTGRALFVDCDVVFQGDVAELFALAMDDYAVMCVKHGELAAEGVKMDGQIQLPYARKNWSSVMLFNCDHPSNRKLTLDLLNTAPGRDLHRFCWLADHEIGALPPAWNWLVNVEPRPPAPKLAHYTLGGPWISGWTGAQNDDLWLRAESRIGTDDRAGHG